MATAGGVAVPILALTLGHVFSNAVRTLPAVAADVLAADLGLSVEGLGAVTAAFPAAFALAMVPTGVALDRYGVRRTALALLAIGTVGAMLAALAGGAAGMLLAQAVLGVGCSGMLMCPVTFAARALPLPRFALLVGDHPGGGQHGHAALGEPARAAGGVAGLAGRLLGLRRARPARRGRRWRCSCGSRRCRGTRRGAPSGRTRGRCSRSPGRRRCGR